ncbi:MAG: sulfatase-like hydrolase/transferase [Pirellulales bacterium]
MNAIVVVANGLHVGYLGCYGNEWVRTPALDALAAGAVVFDQCFVDCPEPLAVHRSWWTGRSAFPAALADEAAAAPAPENAVAGAAPFKDVTPLAQQFTPGPVRTALVTDNWLLHAHAPAVERLFDDVHWIRGQASDRFVGPREVTVRVDDAPDLRLPPAEHPSHEQARQRWEQYLRNRTRIHNEEDTHAARVVGAAVDWLRHDAGANSFLLWLELFDPHAPWDAPEPYRSMYAQDEDYEGVPALVDVAAGTTADDLTELELERLQRTYAGEVTLVDRWLGALFESMQESNLLEETLLLVTSGHGVAFGEHGTIGYEPRHLYEEMVHVPLFVRLPARAAGAVLARCGALVQSIDILPTLVDWFGAAELSGRCEAGGTGVQGAGLLRLANGGANGLRHFGLGGVVVQPAGAPSYCEWSIRSRQWHLLVEDPPPGLATRPRRRLYIKPEDRWDLADVADQYPDVVDRLEGELRSRVER